MFQKKLRHEGYEPMLVDLPHNGDGSYPPTTVPGESFLVVDLGHYFFILRTDVEAFYTFDQEQRLVDIAVRKTVDAP